MNESAMTITIQDLPMGLHLLLGIPNGGTPFVSLSQHSSSAQVVIYSVSKQDVLNLMAACGEALFALGAREGK